MSVCRGRAWQAGFTLLEILVVLVVLGLLLGGLAQGLSLGLRARDTEAKLAGAVADMDGVERLLRALFEKADPGEAGQAAAFSGSERAVQFVSRLPAGATGLPVSDAEIGLGVDARRRLVLRWLPAPHAERLVAAEAMREEVLLAGVDHIELGYRRWPAQGGGWVAAWSEPELPRQVTLKIVFGAGDPRHWPAILVAPMRSGTELRRRR